MSRAHPPPPRTRVKVRPGGCHVRGLASPCGLPTCWRPLSASLRPSQSCADRESGVSPSSGCSPSRPQPALPTLPSQLSGADRCARGGGRGAAVAVVPVGMGAVPAPAAPPTPAPAPTPISSAEGNCWRPPTVAPPHGTCGPRCRPSSTRRGWRSVETGEGEAPVTVLGSLAWGGGEAPATPAAAVSAPAAVAVAAAAAPNTASRPRGGRRHRGGRRCSGPCGCPQTPSGVRMPPPPASIC